MNTHSYTNTFSQTAPEYLLQFDGGSRGNPGTAGSGAVLYRQGEEIWCDATYVGRQTNNYAEYNGLLMGLEYAKEQNIRRLRIEGDSLLVIQQMTGKFQCKSLNLLPLYQRAKELEKEFEHITYHHIYRSHNKRADALSNIGMDMNKGV